jgi:hypothetical protein
MLYRQSPLKPAFLAAPLLAAITADAGTRTSGMLHLFFYHRLPPPYVR